MLSFLTSVWSFRFLQERDDWDGTSTSSSSSSCLTKRRLTNDHLAWRWAWMQDCWFKRFFRAAGGQGICCWDAYIAIPLCQYISISRVYYSIFQVEVGANSDKNCPFFATCSGSSKVVQVSSECSEAVVERLVSALLSAELHSPRVFPSLSRLPLCSLYICFLHRISEILTSKLFSKARLCRNISCILRTVKLHHQISPWVNHEKTNIWKRSWKKNSTLL